MAIIRELMIFGVFWACATCHAIGVRYKEALGDQYIGESPAPYDEKRLLGSPTGDRFGDLKMPKFFYEGA